MQRITLFYNQGVNGWTETWYSNGTTLPTEVNSTLKNVLQLAVAFRSPLTTLDWFRVASIEQPGQVFSQRVATLVKPTTNPDSPPDVVKTSCIYRINGDNYVRRDIELRGLLDDSVIRDPISGVPAPTPGLLKDIGKYLDAAKNAAWGVRQQVSPKSPGAVSAFVLNLVPNINNPELTDLTTPTQIVNGALPPPVRIRFFGGVDKRVLPYFPKSAEVIAFSGTNPQTITFRYTLPNAQTVRPSTLKLMLQLFSIRTISSYQFLNLSSRDTGRPFGSGRGRQSAVTSRR